MNVICECKDCIYCSHINGNLCENDALFIDVDGCCNSYFSCFETSEYKAPYYIAVQTKEGPIGRALKHGKKIIINDRVFYTNNDTRLPENEVFVTDGITGYYCGDIQKLKERWEEYSALISEKEKVEDLPDCRWSNRERNYVIISC